MIYLFSGGRVAKPPTNFVKIHNQFLTTSYLIQSLSKNLKLILEKWANFSRRYFCSVYSTMMSLRLAAKIRISSLNSTKSDRICATREYMHMIHVLMLVEKMVISTICPQWDRPSVVPTTIRRRRPFRLSNYSATYSMKGKATNHSVLTWENRGSIYLWTWLLLGSTYNMPSKTLNFVRNAALT